MLLFSIVLLLVFPQGLSCVDDYYNVIHWKISFSCLSEPNVIYTNNLTVSSSNFNLKIKREKSIMSKKEEKELAS